MIMLTKNSGKRKIIIRIIMNIHLDFSCQIYFIKLFYFKQIFK